MVYRTSQGNLQLNGIFDFVSAGSGATAAAISAGVISATPIVGQVFAATALVSGFIAKAAANAKAGKDSLADAETKKTEAINQLNEVNAMVDQIESAKADIESQIISLGLSGFNDWLQKTFTPAKYYAGEVADVTASTDEIYKLVEGRISYLKTLKNELQALADRLTGGSRNQKIILAGGVIGIAGVTFYFLNKKYKWI